MQIAPNARGALVKRAASEDVHLDTPGVRSVCATLKRIYVLFMPRLKPETREARRHQLMDAAARFTRLGVRPQRFSGQARVIGALVLGLTVLWHVDPDVDPFSVEKQVRTVFAALGAS
jgi:hypothetical protein